MTHPLLSAPCWLNCLIVALLVAKVSNWQAMHSIVKTIALHQDTANTPTSYINQPIHLDYGHTWWLALEFTQKLFDCHICMLKTWNFSFSSFFFLSTPTSIRQYYYATISQVLLPTISFCLVSFEYWLLRRTLISVGRSWPACTFLLFSWSQVLPTNSIVNHNNQQHILTLRYNLSIGFIECFTWIWLVVDLFDMCPAYIDFGPIWCIVI